MRAYSLQERTFNHSDVPSLLHHYEGRWRPAAAQHYIRQPQQYINLHASPFNSLFLLDIYTTTPEFLLTNPGVLRCAVWRSLRTFIAANSYAISTRPLQPTGKSGMSNCAKLRRRPAPSTRSFATLRAEATTGIVLFDGWLSIVKHLQNPIV
jgi:hypothetical protein